MRVGDIVKERCSGQVGMVIQQIQKRELDGNPNGDFTISYQYKVMFGTEIVVIRNARSVDVINESR